MSGTEATTGRFTRSKRLARSRGLVPAGQAGGFRVAAAGLAPRGVAEEVSGGVESPKTVGGGRKAELGEDEAPRLKRAPVP